MKVIQKYFLALVPPTEIFEKAQAIKVALRDQFGIKYALKSPPHITLKMPFNYNEAKEDHLVASLEKHLKGQEPFPVKIGGVGTFGNRVIFLDIHKSPELQQLQQTVSKFCKVKLHLTEELSDRNYRPHMTVAFKDLDARQFPEVLAFVSERGFESGFSAVDLTLLKRVDGIWVSHRKVVF